jgi:hypothetical protein
VLPTAALPRATEPEPEHEVIVVAPRPPGATAGQPPPQQPASRPAASDPSRAATSPVPTTAQPSADQPAARRPTFGSDPPAKPVANARPQGETRIARPGDLICSNCNEPNDPIRRFCRRCGTALAAAVTPGVARRPWWRRIVGRDPRTSVTSKAGNGPHRPATSARKIEVGSVVKRVVAVAIALGLIGAVAVPSVRTTVVNEGTALIDRVRRLISPTLVPVDPVGVSASSELEDHPGRLIIDGATNTDWQADEATPSITVTFQGPVDLGLIIIHNGSAADYRGIRRPTALEFAFEDGSTVDIALIDDHAPKSYDLNKDNVTSVEIRIISSTAEDTPVALSEIEFRTKR